MKVRLLLFAHYRDLAGVEELVLEVPTGATAGEVVSRLRTERGLTGLPVEPAVAVNREYAPLTTKLGDGDELALIPPVAGG